MPRIAFTLSFLGAIVLTGCGALRLPELAPEPPNPAVPAYTPTLAPLLLTPAPTQTPLPTSSASEASPTPTFGLPLPEPTCSATPMWGLGDVWNNESVRTRLGCPVGEQVGVQGEELYFENGHMLWGPDVGLVYVLFDTPWQPEGWGAFVDTFQPSDPDSDPTIVEPTPASGVQVHMQPKGRFGKLWRKSAWLREKLGWAVVPYDDDQALPAIGFGGAGVDREGSKIDYNIYYQDSSVDTYGYPAHYLSGGEYYQMTFEDLQALGYEEHGMVADPKLYDPDNGDLYIMRDSPAFQAGRNLSECNDYLTSIYPVVHTEGPIVYFDKDDVDENLLVATSSWPDGVLTTPQGSYWHIGAFAMETPTITKASGDPEFLTDGSLIGVPVYLVDTTDNYIWKGIIISNTADVLTLDDWEPLFNAEGKQPYGSDYTYYVGYIYLYDKTGRISMFNEYWIKNLKRYELLTNNVEENETVYFRFSADHEKTVHDDSSSLSMERPNVLVHDVKGMNKNFVLEHAMITKQSIRVKGSVYYGAWMRGTMVQ